MCALAVRQPQQFSFISVKGMIIARTNDLKLQYALKAVPNVVLFVYKVRFALEKATSF